MTSVTEVLISVREAGIVDIATRVCSATTVGVPFMISVTKVVTSAERVMGPAPP